MMRVLVEKLEEYLEKEVMVEGWVNSRRDHGGLIFIDLRDHTGVIQLVVTPENEKAFKLAETLRDEFVIKAVGRMREREPELVNPNIETGKIELVVTELTLLNRSEPLPVNTHDDGNASSEELRLKYRFLDLRRPLMQKRLKRRSEFYRFIRNYMYENGFTEVTTPILANSSPEGARDFLVPSRLHPGKFYALPQAPQQFKQLLMVGGLDKYFQIAPCFRDEDPRADRLYGDFYQLDFEMAFVEDGEVIRKTIQPLYERLIEEFAGKKLVLKSEIAKQYIPEGETIPRIPFEVSMNFYGVDKPDLRYGMELVDLTEAFKDTDFKVFKQPCVKAICVKGGAELTRREIDEFTERARKLGAGGLAYIFYTDEGEKSPILKFISPAEITAVREKTKAEKGDAVFFGADTTEKVNKVLGQLRIMFADRFELKKPEEVALAWIVDFPFYEWDEKNRKIEFGHNPFSMPKGGLEALEAADTVEKKLKIVADQYDMVMNGYEVLSGAVRNYNPEIMYKVFNILGYDNEYVEARFGGMLSAFKFGAPPHAGAAPGLDRIFMILEDEENIRDVVAFPKNGNGVDLMMNSPSAVDPVQLEEAHLAILPEEE
ncbi:MAG: aspartate--tRNA ligase [Candidatus Saccharibacteria bacterium]|nr:aspartate--tRNA ligase [Candidatus Saccharibacteria bacterium]